MIVFRAVMSIALAILASSAFAFEVKTYYVNADNLNVRGAPDGSAVLVRKLTRGAEIKVYALETSWARISQDGRAGEWVSRRYICEARLCWLKAAAPSTRVSSGAAPSYSAPRRSGGSSAGCPCSGSNNCFGPRGGRYCITSGGNKRYR